MLELLRELCEKEDLKAIEQLCHEELTIDDLNMALRTIALTNNISIAKCLIQRGANSFTMALSEATSGHGTDDMISFLLSQGADMNDWMAMENAIQQNEDNAVQLLITAGFTLWDKALLSSVELGRISFVLLFLHYHQPTPQDLELFVQCLQRHPNPEIQLILGLT